MNRRINKTKFGFSDPPVTCYLFIWPFFCTVHKTEAFITKPGQKRDRYNFRVVKTLEHVKL